MFVAHSLNNGKEPTATLEAQLDRNDTAGFFNEVADVLKYCNITGITWLLSHERYLQLIRGVSNDHIVTNLTKSVLSHRNSAVVLGILVHTYQCKQFAMQSSFYQKSASREMLVALILADDEAHVLLSNLFAALHCRAMAAAVEFDPCKSGQRRWNVLRQIVLKIRDANGFVERSHTEKWIREVAVCLSWVSNIARIECEASKYIVALALSATEPVIFEAQMILDKCACCMAYCGNDCIMACASRMCIPRKSTYRLLQRFVTRMSIRFADYEEHITTGKCPLFKLPLQFFSAEKLRYDIEPEDAQALLDIDFKGGRLGNDMSINDRTFTLVQFLNDSSQQFKIKIPHLTYDNFQVFALMVMCGVMHKYKNSMIVENDFWRHDTLWKTFGILNNYVVYKDGACPESMAQMISAEIEEFLPEKEMHILLELQNSAWFQSNEFISRFWSDLRHAILKVPTKGTERGDFLIDIARQFSIPPEVLFLRNRAAASKVLVGNETRHRIKTFMCAVQRSRSKNEICVNNDVLYIVLSIYFSDLFRS